MKRLFPSLVPYIHIIIGYSYDIFKFLKNNTSIQYEKNKNKISSIITRQYHGVEKGMTLPNVRKGYGNLLISKLIENCNLYIDKYGMDDLIANVNKCLKKYLDFNNDCEEDQFKILKIKISEFLKNTDYSENLFSSSAGIKKIFKKNWLDNTTDFLDITRTRKSIRNFDESDVNIKLIYRSIEMSMNTPSACNNQHECVFLKKNNILRFQ